MIAASDPHDNESRKHGAVDDREIDEKAADDAELVHPDKEIGEARPARQIERRLGDAHANPDRAEDVHEIEKLHIGVHPIPFGRHRLIVRMLNGVLDEIGQAADERREDEILADKDGDDGQPDDAEYRRIALEGEVEGVAHGAPNGNLAHPLPPGFDPGRSLPSIEAGL